LANIDDGHPADSIGTSLVRANGILAAISVCFVDNKGQFAVNEPFVAQAVRAVEGLLADATTQLDRLYDEIDLSWKHARKDSSVKPMPVEAVADPEVELSAKTYDALLRKLTAAEIFAADLSESENDLLPLLNDIKEELQRSRKFG
jgi:hypothetical protein